MSCEISLLSVTIFFFFLFFNPKKKIKKKRKKEKKLSWLILMSNSNIQAFWAALGQTPLSTQPWAQWHMAVLVETAAARG